MAADLAVIGAGAIGTYLAGVALRAGHRVTLVVRRRDQRDALRRDGIVVRTPDESWHGTPEVVLAEDLSADRRFDGVMLSVKVGATREALTPVLAHIDPAGAVLCCQNGLNDEQVAALAGAERTVAAVLSIPVVLEADGISRCLVDDPFVELGAIVPGGASAAARAATFFGPPLDVRQPANIAGARWSKLAVNCSTGPLLALTDLTLKELTDREEAREIMLALIREVMATAALEGVTPVPLWGLGADDWLDGPEDAALEIIRQAGAANPRARSSMWADLTAGRRTEIDALNGSVMDRALAKGSAAPVNATLWSLVSRADNGDKPKPEAVWDCLRRAMQKAGGEA